MSVLGPGATCCEQSDCTVDCGFDKSQVTSPEPAPVVDPVVTTDAPVTTAPVEVADPNVKVDSTDKPQSDTAPDAS